MPSWPSPSRQQSAAWLWLSAALDDNVRLPGYPLWNGENTVLSICVILCNIAHKATCLSALSKPHGGFSKKLPFFSYFNLPTSSQRMWGRGKHREKLWGEAAAGSHPPLTFVHTRQSPSFRIFLPLAPWTLMKTDLHMGSSYWSTVFQKFLDMPEFSWKHT